MEAEIPNPVRVILLVDPHNPLSQESPRLWPEQDERTNHNSQHESRKCVEMDEDGGQDIVTEVTMETDEGRLPANRGEGGLVTGGIEENPTQDGKVHTADPQRHRQV